VSTGKACRARAVEAFANVAGGCRQQHWLARVHRIPVRELLQDDTPLSRGYGAVQHHRRQATGVQFGGELVDVLGPSCHHQAVTATSDRVHHVIDDLRGADPVRHECRDDDRLKDAGRVAVDVVTDRGGSWMNMQFLITVFPAPGGATSTPSSYNPAEFRQMHDLAGRDLGCCADDARRRVWPACA